VIYIDSSVVLAYLFTEQRSPPVPFWRQPLTSSRLLEYEVWTRIHARKLANSHGEAARAIIDGMILVELTPSTLERATEPFPVPLRTLDALHLSTVEYLRSQGQDLELASYDERLLVAARAMKIGLAAL
jgi:predicted nucleic acid-binding protein